MKNAIAAFALLFSVAASGQYDVDLAGNFSYEYVSTNTDGTVKYNVKYHYVCDTGFTGLTTNTFARYKKNSSSSIVSMSMSSVVASTTLMNTSPCGDHLYNQMTWEQTLDLDPNSQYEFVNSWCCRAPYIANIDTNGGLPNQFARMIMLTGRQGVRPNNSSPNYNKVYFSVPLNTPTPLEICSLDPDGDSLSFVIINSKKGFISTQGFVLNNISYDTLSGYSSAQPLGPGGSVSIDQGSRMLMVKSDSSQFNLLTVRVIEWAKDSSNTYKIMGVNNKEMFIDFTDGYTPSIYGINANYATSSLNSDSVYVNLKKSVFLTSGRLDSNIVMLKSPSNDTAVIADMGYAGSKSELYLRTDSLKEPGVWKIYFTQQGNFANRGLCGEALKDTVYLNIPIPPIKLVGDTGYVYVGPSREYYALNGQYYDSISWFCTNGIVTGGNSDTVQVDWGSNSNGPGFLKVEAVKVKDGSNFILSLSNDSLNVNVNGLSLTEQENGIKLYPNPAINEINVLGVSNGVDYKLVNSNGKTILRGTVEGPRISLPETPVGQYFLMLRLDSGWLTKDLLIVR